MPKKKRPITAGNIVFEIFFILSYPFIAVFSAAVTVIVWIFSLPSKILAFLGSKK
ncbi:MAG: hypothetical protein ACKOWQ_05620 [Aquirufa sp.]